MGKYLNPGNEAFCISVEDDIYVDKSGLISFTNSRIGKRKRYLCASRPRRFGKSMTAEMLSAYYSRNCDSEALFHNLEIAKDKSYRQHLNHHDVIFINTQHFLRKAGKPENLANYLEEKVLAEVKKIYSDYVDPDETSLPEALASIFEKEERPDKGFVFIIDEWDCIFREAKEDKQAHKVYLDFLRDLFKDRTYVKLAYMTGILPIKKYGTHSALNIFDEFSMTDPKVLSKYVGFTEMEVKKLCKKHDLDFAEAQRWYDGYRLKKSDHVYNPKSIIDAIVEGEFKSYWTKTETYEALKVYVDLNFDGLKDAIIAMLGGNNCNIDTGTFQNDMTSFTGKDDVLTLLVHLGYLAYNEDNQEVFIPNEEVRAEFLRAIKQSGWNEVADAVTASEKLLEATLDLKAEEVARCISAVHSDNTSVLAYHDENSLSCVITLAYYSARKDYILIRELPTGEGFADIVFLPRQHSDKPALVVELKWNRSAQGAINQIKEKQYIKALEKYTGEILAVGISYDKKTKVHSCVIEKLQK